MLELSHVHIIRHKHFVEGQSIRAVARDMGVSRNTVRKYLRAEDPQPEYTQSKCRPRPVLDKVGPRIDELLEEWSGRTTNKQRITSPRVHQALLDEGYEIGERTVREYLAEWRRQRAETHIPLEWRPGDAAQVDFFEVVIEVDGERRKAWMFVMRMMFSKRDFAYVYERQDQVSFLDGHVRAFAAFGGVPARIIYDNLKPAVKRFLRNGKRELTDRFLALVTHYVFEPCFARRGKGNDKGGVEARGKGLRWQHLTPIPVAADMDGINANLAAKLERQMAERKDRQGQTVLDRWPEETPLLHRLPAAAFDPAKLSTATVSSQALVRVESASYSVPSSWKRLEVKVFAGPQIIRIVRGDEEVTHPRVPKNERHIDYTHYLDELSRKPQALRQVAPELTAALGAPYSELYDLLEATHGPRKAARLFADLLAVMQDHDDDALSQSLSAMLDAGGDISLLDLGELRAPPPRLAKLPAGLADIHVESARAADFDLLLLEAD